MPDPAAKRERLRALATNLWWCWDAEATALFASLDPDRWEDMEHRPLALLEELEDARLKEPALARRLARVEERLAAYLASRDTWCRNVFPEFTGPVAYFSMEFALHESLPIYSGGLGVLAGDHLKSASDLGIPFVGVGLLYREGYFRQLIDHGRQVVAYPAIPMEHLPLSPLDVQVEIPHGHHTYLATAWELKVGRARLLLLDSDVEGNAAEHRELCTQLYGGAEATRIAQEVLLGIGGMRLLAALGIDPVVVHLNEGHCAFAVLEQWRSEMAGGKKPGEALVAARSRFVFTTHTPVPAGHDRFGWELKKEALGGMREDMGLPEGAFMDLGRVKPSDLHEPMCMTVLALKGSRAANGVSALHGVVSRKMWKDLYPTLSEEEVPIGHVTNGVHGPSWTHPRVARAERENAGDAALWALKGDLRRELITHAHRKLGRDRLDPDALTIGFARRFAPYKRGNLLFTDPDRLARLLADPHRPVQIVFAGKAHPRDLQGAGIVRDVLRWTRDERFRGRVVFLEDYDMDLGRRLVQGVDVWLNNPRRPREASGTSGMKSAMNLGINLSVLDGWWPEAFDGTNGWAIGDDTEYDTPEAQDAADARSLYRALEEEVVAEFYDRDGDGVPEAWVRRMRRSWETCRAAFHTDRMVREYAGRYYCGG